MADPETTAAFDRIAKLVGDSNEDSRRRSKEIYDRMDANHEQWRAKSEELGLKLQETTTAFNGHAEQDGKDFIDVRKRLDAHDGRWWKLITGTITGSGLVAGFIQFLTGKGSP